MYLPTCFFYAGNEPLIGEVTETDSADTELSIDCSWTTAELASVFGSCRKFRFPLCFQYFCFACHCFSYTKFCRIITAFTDTSSPQIVSKNVPICPPSQGYSVLPGSHEFHYATLATNLVKNYRSKTRWARSRT